MAKKRADLRVEGQLLDWADSYARQRGTTRTAIVEAGLRSLREDAVGGEPDIEAALPPAPRAGTEHWRDPTEAEVASARARHPDLPDDRLYRLARAEARQVDMGIPQPKVPEQMTREVAKGYVTPSGEVGRGGGDFEEHTRARAETVGRLHTPDSIKGAKKS